MPMLHRTLALLGALAAAACATPVVVMDPHAHDALVAAPADDTVVSWTDDQALVAEIRFPGVFPPRVGAAVGAEGETLLAWIEGRRGEANSLVVFVERGGRSRRDVVSGDAAVYDGDVAAGFAADGSAIVVHEGGLIPSFATSHVLPPGAATWSDASSVAPRGAGLIALDAGDASRAALAGSSPKTHWEKLTRARTYLPSVCPDPLVEFETTIAAAELVDGRWDVDDFGIHETVRHVARAGDVLAASIDVRDGPDRIVAIDARTGDETVLAELDGASDVAAAATETGTFVAWTDRGGVAVRERDARGTDAWSPPARIPGSTWGSLSAASGPGWVLVTVCTRARVHAWIRRGGAWSRTVVLSGWAAVPACDRGRPVIFRVVGAPDAATGGAERRVPSAPSIGSIVRVEAAW